MKAVIPEIPPHILEYRKRTGIDKWDEMWEGVLHMPPSPNVYHQDFQWELENWIRMFWARPLGNKVYHEINVASVGDWPNDYRIPDLVLLTPDCFDINRIEYFEGAPTAVVEIRRPGDETFEKLPFYTQLGVPEVWVIDRDTKELTFYRLLLGEYEEQAANSDGWHYSAATGIRFRHESPNKIAIQMGEDQSTRRVLPEG
jgi:Uma2 family endonuclease